MDDVIDYIDFIDEYYRSGPLIKVVVTGPEF